MIALLLPSLEILELGEGRRQMAKESKPGTVNFLTIKSDTIGDTNTINSMVIDGII